MMIKLKSNNLKVYTRNPMLPGGMYVHTMAVVDQVTVASHHDHSCTTGSSERAHFSLTVVASFL